MHPTTERTLQEFRELKDRITNDRQRVPDDGVVALILLTAQMRRVENSIDSLQPA